MDTSNAETDPRIQTIIQELQQWPGPPIASHKSASQYFHKLEFLADMGIPADTPGLSKVIERIMDSCDIDGIPSLPLHPRKDDPQDTTLPRGWALCDAPIILYALATFGVQKNRIGAAIDHLAKLPRPEGYTCSVSKSLSYWHGPGKRSEACPYATLAMLKLFTATPRSYPLEAAACAECLLTLWANSRTRHPYMFYAGTDFRKLKMPLFWYDILHVTEVLSRYEAVRQDPRMLDMYQAIEDKRTPAGFVPESVYLSWKDWDFGQKKTPSATMTTCIDRIRSRLYPASTW